MEDWLKLLIFFLFSFGGCAYCYWSGARRGFRHGCQTGYLKGYEEGYSHGLHDGVHGEESKAIIAMLRDNVAKKVEEKIRAEYRNGTRQP
jgi:hypothetical protein